jgi:hypothetical protein
MIAILRLDDCDEFYLFYNGWTSLKFYIMSCHDTVA